MHLDDIQKLGAQAARKGLTLWDCPFYRVVDMPGHTGEPISVWANKVRAWEAGWRAQKRRRSTTTRAGSRRLVPPHRRSAVLFRSS